MNKKTHEFGKRVDFGKSAENYGKHRQGFPERYFNLLSEKGLCREGQKALDVGTGTGSVARGLAALGATVYAIDPARELLAQARTLAGQVGVTINFSVGKAEELAFDTSSFDLVTAGQCWHWLDRIKAEFPGRFIEREDIWFDGFGMDVHPTVPDVELVSMGCRK